MVRDRLSPGEESNPPGTEYFSVTIRGVQFSERGEKSPIEKLLGIRRTFAQNHNAKKGTFQHDGQYVSTDVGGLGMRGTKERSGQ
jgi:hypothetical protein